MGKYFENKNSHKTFLHLNKIIFYNPFIEMKIHCYLFTYYMDNLPFTGRIFKIRHIYFGQETFEILKERWRVLDTRFIRRLVTLGFSFVFQITEI